MATEIKEGRIVHNKNGKFAIGNNANPRGAGAHNEVRRAFAKLTKKQFEDFIHILFSSHPDDLKVWLEQNPTVLNRWLVQAGLNGMKTGNLDPLFKLVERVIGKVPDISQIEHSTKKNKNLKIEFVTTASTSPENPDVEKELK